MILVDTCGWIEWLTEGALADSFAPYMKDPADLLVPTTVQYELFAKFQTSFYSDPVDAAFKALGVE